MLAYLVLGVTPDDSDETIRSAYMTLSQRYSPDRHPDYFKKLRAAYDQIKTQENRLAYDLFACDTLSYHDLGSLLLAKTQAVKLTTAAFQEYCKEICT